MRSLGSAGVGVEDLAVSLTSGEEGAEGTPVPMHVGPTPPVCVFHYLNESEQEGTVRVQAVPRGREGGGDAAYLDLVDVIVYDRVTVADRLDPEDLHPEPPALALDHSTALHTRVGGIHDPDPAVPLAHEVQQVPEREPCQRHPELRPFAVVRVEERRLRGKGDMCG